MADAYLTALRMLARREYSEQQVRERLTKREFDAAEVDDAITRLKDQRSLDDRRVAGAMARLELLVRRHGRLRAERQMKAAGLSPALIREALDATLADTDPDELVAAALARRLRHGQTIEDDKHFQRLYRYLIGQGFSTEQALTALKAARRGTR
ncbi:MAG: RecX family transcriptional regulator [Vicinamibacterales bacterium]